MATALSDTTIELVKKTVPALEAHGTAVTDRMYQLLFRNPDIRDLFNQSHHGESGSQSKALTAAVIAYARNIDNLGVLASRVERITQKHVGAEHPARALPLRGRGAARRDQGRAGRGRHGRDPRGLGRGVLVPGRPPDRARGQSSTAGSPRLRAAGTAGATSWSRAPGRRARSSAPSSWSRPMAAR